MKYPILTCCLLALFASGVALAQTGRSNQPDRIDPKPFADNANHWYGIGDQHQMISPLPDKPQYKPTQLTEIGDNILLFQKANGGWPKNYDVFAILTDDQKEAISRRRHEVNTTFDNGSSYTQIAALAVVYSATHIDKYRDGAFRGMDFLLGAQYANGGWPQYYPLEKKYSKAITFNDGAIEGIMNLLKDILDAQPPYAFLHTAYGLRVKAAFDRGLDCIVKSQINDNGVPTAWCQQHDEKTLQPVWARKFEPASICNGESAGIVLFLMSIDKPDQRVVNAVQYAVKWFQDSKIYNTRVETVKASTLNTDYRISTTDRVVVTDSAAPPIWTRFYELKTHRPLFCNRDSKLVYSLAEVERERRDGYSWYTYAPQRVLNSYPSWQKKWAPANNVLAP